MNAEELGNRAKKLKLVVRERAEMTQRLGRLPDETMQDFIDSELLKVLVPVRFGGFGLDWRVAAEIVEEVASGCASTGFVLFVYICTNWTVGTMTEQAQREIYGTRGFTIGPCPLNVRLGNARKVEGGVRISAHQPFGTGVHHADWVILGALIEPDTDSKDQAPEAIQYAVPRAEFEAPEKTWSTMGMQGTGSKDIIVRDVFVPWHRVVKVDDHENGTSPGAILHGPGVYSLSQFSGFLATFEAFLIGVARDGVEAFQELLGKQYTMISAGLRGHSQANQIRLAEALAYLDAAKLMTDRDLGEITSVGQKGELLSMPLRVRIVRNGAFVASLCRHAVDICMEASGANALRSGTRLERVFRDLHMISGNHFLGFDLQMETYGRFALGLPFDLYGKQ